MPIETNSVLFDLQNSIRMVASSLSDSQNAATSYSHMLQKFEECGVAIIFLNIKGFIKDIS